LLEVLLSLSIIAIILIMATRYFFVASNNDKINTTVSQIGGLIAAGHNYKGAGTDYAGVSIIALGQSGQLTNFPGFDDKTNRLTSMWGSEYAIEPVKLGALSLAKITVVLPDIATCIAINRAFPDDGNAHISSSCNTNTFTYIFP
jgi:type II secretory pathway pseudopilin PulG